MSSAPRPGLCASRLYSDSGSGSDHGASVHARGVDERPEAHRGGTWRPVDRRHEKGGGRARRVGDHAPGRERPDPALRRAPFGKPTIPVPGPKRAGRAGVTYSLSRAFRPRPCPPGSGKGRLRWWSATGPRRGAQHRTLHPPVRRAHSLTAWHALSRASRPRRWPRPRARRAGGRSRSGPSPRRRLATRGSRPHSALAGTRNSAARNRIRRTTGA